MRLEVEPGVDLRAIEHLTDFRSECIRRESTVSTPERVWPAADGTATTSPASALVKYTVNDVPLATSL